MFCDLILQENPVLCFVETFIGSLVLSIALAIIIQSIIHDYKRRMEKN